MDGYKTNGKRNIVSFTAPTKGEVQQLMRRRLEGIDLEEDVECTMPTFSEWADRWYTASPSARSRGQRWNWLWPTSCR